MCISPLVLAARILDAKWDEAKHPREANGRFGEGGVQPKSPLRRAAETIQSERKPRRKPKRKRKQSAKISPAEREHVTHEISTWFHGRFQGLRKSSIAVNNYVYFFFINEYGDYTIYHKEPLK